MQAHVLQALIARHCKLGQAVSLRSSHGWATLLHPIRSPPTSHPQPARPHPSSTCAPSCLVSHGGPPPSGPMLRGGRGRQTTHPAAAARRPLQSLHRSSSGGSSSTSRVPQPAPPTRCCSLYVVVHCFFGATLRGRLTMQLPRRRGQKFWQPCNPAASDTDRSTKMHAGRCRDCISAQLH